jgi:ABC-type sugar transport system, periplasmic component
MQQGKGPRSGRNHRTVAPVTSTAPEAPGGGPVLNRRSMMKALGLGAAGIAVPGLVAGCSASSGGATRIVFEETKPEVVPYFNNLVAKFNASQSHVVVTHDFTSSLIAEFVRGNPPAIDCDNYNLTTSIFVARGVLADLAHLPQAKLINPNIQALVNQYASFHGETNVLPFSVAAEGVIYNMDLFDKVGVSSVPDHMERIPRGVREVQVQEHHADLPDLRRHLDHAAGPVRLHRRRHDRRRGVLPAARSRGHQPRP